MACASKYFELKYYRMVNSCFILESIYLYKYLNTLNA